MADPAYQPTRHAPRPPTGKLRGGVHPPWLHTRRELHIIWLVSAGYTDYGAAHVLGLKYNSVKTRVHEMKLRANAVSRTTLIAMWLRWHIAHGSTDATERPFDLPDHRPLLPGGGHHAPVNGYASSIVR